MNYKGLKKASSETKYCSKSGTFGECEIALNVKTGKVYATWRYGNGNFTMWHDISNDTKKNQRTIRRGGGFHVYAL